MNPHTYSTFARGRHVVGALASALLIVHVASASALAASVTVKSKNGAVIDEYRWVIEEDLTFPVVPDTVGPQTLSVSFHRSYMPVVASGETFGPNASLPAAVALNPDRRYFVSVVPRGGYANGGAPVGASLPAVVIVDELPLPIAQIAVLAFHDNRPINNAPDVAEEGLPNFEVRVSDIAGHQVQDAFGNPIGSTYRPCTEGEIEGGDCPLPGSMTLDAAGNGTIKTGPDGKAFVKNVHPGKYGVQILPPAGSGWSQTSTIEGTKTVDAWVTSNEPGYFVEFGVPTPHVFVGFVHPVTDTRPMSGRGSITGQIVNLHTDGPPFFQLHEGAPFAHTIPWVGLNDLAAGGGQSLYVRRANDDGSFSITGVPNGTYQLVIWDEYLDIIFAFQTVTITQASSSVALGTLPVFNWFSAAYGFVFEDTNENGFKDPGEAGIPEIAMNLRFRDGTIYQSYPTDLDGFVPFEQVFPFFSWLVAEVDFAKFKPTGVTVVVDAGGAVDANAPWPDDVGIPADFAGFLVPQAQPDNGGLPYRTEVTAPQKPASILLEGFQGFAGQSNVFLWGKSGYGPGDVDNEPYCGEWNDDGTCGDGDFPDGIGDEDYSASGEANGKFDPGNGGISGVVHYSTTRAEDDPRFGAGEPWEPGVPNVTVRLWNSDRSVLYQEVQTDSWDANQPTGCAGEPYVHRGMATDCFDGIRNWNQIRPAVFDGGYAIDSRWLPSLGAAGAVEVPGIPAGEYVVEVVVPPGYELVKEEDKNVDFGNEYVPAAVAEQGLAAASRSAGLLATTPIGIPECVGDSHDVPDQLDLFPGVDVVTTTLVDIDTETPGLQRPLCDRKLVVVRDGQNPAANFFLFTKAPVAGHIFGTITDDIGNEGNAASPVFGEKYAPPFLPVAIQDWSGNEISRVYSDEFGRYNALVPSTYTANVPAPSGMSPNMLRVCLNPATMPDPNDASSVIPEPHFNRSYGQVCLAFQYLPGTTTYLDTPVLPVAAFAGQDQFPVDCESPSLTPVISRVMGMSTHGGPYIEPGGSRLLTIVSPGNVSVLNPQYDGPGGSQPKNIMRNYGFGATRGQSQVTLGGTALPAGAYTTWSNDMIVVNVPASFVDGRYELLVRRGNASTGKTSVTGVTLTIGTPLSAVRSVGADQTIQQVIDLANPGDLVLVPPGAHNEMVIMAKPVLLQGWGVDSQIIARKYPPEKLGAWRDRLAQEIALGNVTLLPGQTGIGPFDGEGSGVLVWGRDVAPASGGFGLVGGVPNSRIDGLTISGADLGGAIFANGYARQLEIANNRIAFNSGLYGGGIRLGHPNLAVGTTYTNAQNTNVQIHHNQIILNGTEADALLGATGGGVAIYTGSNNYGVSRNFVCGNFTVADGGGIGHRGLSTGGRIERNTVVFNESFNQGITVSGGGIFVGGAAPLGAATLTPGSGSVLINANQLHGNQAGGGDGGGIRIDSANGQDVLGPASGRYRIDIVNNIISQNVAALAGAGISLQDAVRVSILHNSVARNDSLAVAGEAFAGDPGTTVPQPAGIVSRAHSQALAAALPAAQPRFSQPVDFRNNIVWQNRSFYFGPITPTPPPPALPFGLLPRPAGQYWDLGVLGVTASLNCLACTLSGNGSPNFLRPNFNENLATSFLNDRQPIGVTIAFDEGGNFIRPRYGPITLINPATGLPFADYHITQNTAISLPIILGVVGIPELALDFDGQARPGTALGVIVLQDRGADEWPQP